MISNKRNIKKLTELKHNQYALMFSGKSCREKYINMLNDKLKIYGLESIEIKKYKDENELVKTIKEINSKNSNLEKFLLEFLKSKTDSRCSKNFKLEKLLLEWLNIKTDSGDSTLSCFFNHIDMCLLRNNGKYYISDDYTENDNYIHRIEIPIKHILNTKYIVYNLKFRDSEDIYGRAFQYIEHRSVRSY